MCTLVISERFPNSRREEANFWKFTDASFGKEAFKKSDPSPKFNFVFLCLNFRSESGAQKSQNLPLNYKSKKQKLDFLFAVCRSEKIKALLLLCLPCKWRVVLVYLLRTSILKVHLVLSASFKVDFALISSQIRAVKNARAREEM